MGALLTQFMNKYAYTDFHELNADWMIRTMMELINQVENFVSLNAIKYADPIQWDITRQYEKNTVVIDPVTGTAYISVAPVPMGVALTNTDYWTVVFDLGSFVVRAAKNFSNRYEAETTLTATFPSNQGDWIVWGDTLYEALSNITAGDQYVVNSNIKHFTMEEVCDALAQAIQNVQNNVTALDTKVGDLNDLTTLIKTSVVNAINEVVSNLSQEILDRQNADTSLHNDIVNKPFINVKDFGAVGDGITNDTQAFNDALTVSGANGVLFVPHGVYVLDNAFSTTATLYCESGTEIINAVGGAPHYCMRPTTNLYNVTNGISQKFKGALATPPSGGTLLSSKEMLSDNASEYINIVGNITSGSNIITTSSDTSNINIGDAIYNTNISEFANTSPGTCMRVTDVTSNSITFAPDLGDGGGTGRSPYTYNGNSYSGASLTIRKRLWHAVEFLGCESGTALNPDAVYWCANDVGIAHAQRVITREIGIICLDGTNDRENIGVFIPIVKRANVNAIGVKTEGSGNYNATIGIASTKAYTGMFSSAMVSYLFSPTYDDCASGTTQPTLGGLVQSDYPTGYASFRPSIAIKQMLNSGCALVIARENDTTPGGYYILCRDATGNGAIFGVDTNGNETVGGNSNVFGNIVASGNIKGTEVTATGGLHGLNLQLRQNVIAGAPTPNGYMTLYNINNQPVQVPIYDPNL